MDWLLGNPSLLDMVYLWFSSFFLLALREGCPRCTRYRNPFPALKQPVLPNFFSHSHAGSTPPENKDRRRRGCNQVFSNYLQPPLLSWPVIADCPLSTTSNHSQNPILRHANLWLGHQKIRLSSRHNCWTLRPDDDRADGNNGAIFPRRW